MESSVAPTPPSACGTAGGSGDVKRTMGVAKRPSDFSIEHILRNAGRRTSGGAGVEGNPAAPGDGPRQPETEAAVATRFEWLQCTRYHPPKLPRSRRKDGAREHSSQPGASGQRGEVRRKLGRNPRIPFSSGQVSALESRFRRGHYLSSADVASLARALDLSEARVKIWFQNRRARERRDRESARAPSGAQGPSSPPDALNRLTACGSSDDPEGHLSAPRPASVDSPPRRQQAPEGAGLFPKPPLQGPHSAFVPFPRSRPPPTDAPTSQVGGHLAMTSFGAPSIVHVGGCCPGQMAAPV